MWLNRESELELEPQRGSSILQRVTILAAWRCKEGVGSWRAAQKARERWAGNEDFKLVSGLYSALDGLIMTVPRYGLLIYESGMCFLIGH